MSQQITLQVGGIGYNGNRAGSNGQQVTALLSGPPSDRVFFRKELSLGGMIGSLVGLNDRVGEAYVKAEDRGTLRDAGVIFNPETDVEGAGMSQYVLWLVPD